jgi:Uma2 family endonuclease
VSQTPLEIRRWKRAEYDRLIDLGVFERDPLELIGGQIFVAEPQSAYPLRAVLPLGWIISVQSPVSLDDESEPEPDLAVVPGRPTDYRHGHPTRPSLVVEIAESSVGFDRLAKGSLYARAQVQDYWIVNLIDRVLEVYREPGADPSTPYGWSYRSVARLTPPAAITLLDPAAGPIAVADLLP